MRSQKRKRPKKYELFKDKDGFLCGREAKKKKKQNWYLKCFESYVELVINPASNTYQIKESIFQRKYDQEVIAKLIPHILSLAQRMRDDLNPSEQSTAYLEFLHDDFFSYEWVKMGEDRVINCLYAYMDYTVHFSISADNTWMEIALSRKGVLQHFINGIKSVAYKKLKININRSDELEAIRAKAIKNTENSEIKNLNFKIMNTIDNNENLLFFDVHERLHTVYITVPNFRNHLISQGYRCNKKNRNNICRIINNVIIPSCIEDIVSDIIKEINQGPDVVHKFLNGNKITKDSLIAVFLRESQSLLKKHLLYSLDEIEVKPLKDLSQTSYLPYKNCVVEASADSINVRDYKNLPSPVCKEQIIPRQYKSVPYQDEDSVFYKFCFNLAKKDPQRFLSLRTILGYLIHTYKDPSNAFMVILMDERIPDFGEANGGVGKSLIGVALEHIRSVAHFDARRDNLKSRFCLDQVNLTTNILYIEDTDPDFSIDHAYNLITGKTTINVRYQSSYTIPFKDGFKILTTTNYVPTGSGGDSHDRRIMPFEVGEHYSKGFTPRDEFGQNLFEEWDEDEWAKFDAFMIKSLQLYFEHGIIRPPKINQCIRAVIQKTNHDFYEWFHKQYTEGKRSWDKKIELEIFKKLYTDYKSIKLNTFTMWIHCYLRTNNIKYRSTASDTRPTDTRGKIVVD